MNRWRCWSLFIGLSFGAAACTKENPAYHCQNSTCIDPAFPYCDADGTIGGTAGVCIAVTCTAGEFGKCSGASALTCNDTGTGYVETQCAHGCDEDTGCKLCETGQTVCSNGTVATCDATGNQTSATQCPLGCFEDQPRCRDIDPSNGLGTYLDSVASPPDIDLTGEQFIVYADTGEVFDAAQTLISVPTFVAVQSGNAPPIRVFVAKTLKLGDVLVRIKNPMYGPSLNPAVAFLATGDISVVGAVRLQGAFASPGGVWWSECKGGDTVYASNAPLYEPGSGGGGFATVGAKGGKGLTLAAGVGGGTSGNDTLIPLRGGCGSGYTSDQNFPVSPNYGVAGGGALQLVSKSKVTVLANAKIDVTGSGGTEEPQAGASGGGAGGGLLIEAPLVDLGDHVTLDASGGAGANGDGGDCSHGHCGLGGAGAGPLTPAQPGADAPNSAGDGDYYGGGGGGGLGRIRINTSDNTYTKTNTTAELGALTAGRIATH